MMLQDIEVKCQGRLRYYGSDLHGLDHLREVALLAGHIAAEMGSDVEASMVAGFLHDCGRMNDGGGNQHAHDSAKLAEPILAECFLNLDAPAILEAIRLHADGLTTDDPIAGALWDADRLTLIRLGMKVRPELLSTSAARRMLAQGWHIVPRGH